MYIAVGMKVGKPGKRAVALRQLPLYGELRKVLASNPESLALICGSALWRRVL